LGSFRHSRLWTKKQQAPPAWTSRTGSQISRLEEAAEEICNLEAVIGEMDDIIDRLERRLNINDD
jgi:hypothetical protein